jgi:hypothetical protein
MGPDFLVNYCKDNFTLETLRFLMGCNVASAKLMIGSADFSTTRCENVRKQYNRLRRGCLSFNSEVIAMYAASANFEFLC